MKIKIHMEKMLPDYYFDDENLAELTDDQVLEICLEDVIDLIDEAAWRIERIAGSETAIPREP